MGKYIWWALCTSVGFLIGAVFGAVIGFIIGFVLWLMYKFLKFLSTNDGVGSNRSDGGWDFGGDSDGGGD